MIRAQVIGATGYGGCGIIELILGHPEIQLASLMAKTDYDRPIYQYFPHLMGLCDLVVEKVSEEKIGRNVELVIFSTPDEVGMRYARKALMRGAAVIDFSGDFRFKDIGVYERYASLLPRSSGRSHSDPELLKEAVYGIPELYRERIARARLVGNPGCFAVPMILGLVPALKHKMVKPDSLICDGKTGISGAGKKPSPIHHFPERNENATAYRIASHQHTVETEISLSEAATEEVRITFVPHLLPTTRGILCTLYAELRAPLKEDDVQEIYLRFYEGERFVRIHPPGNPPGIKSSTGSNYCDIALKIDKPKRRLVVIASIDNLMKGQAGIALQNINLMMGLPEDMGLDRPGRYP